MTHEPRPAPGPRHILATLRPQTYGPGSPARVPDPIVEPLWTGIRALAAVDAAGAALVDEFGEAIDAMGVIVDALVAGARADSIVLDGFITKQATRGGSGIYLWSDDMPSLGTMVGLRRNRATDAMRLKERALETATFAPDDEVCFVAIDLLWLDDTALLDVPLLERRRLLEGVVEESATLRVGAFVRPPIDAWVGSWRAQGFSGITFKAANSRYLPGEPNPDWVVSGMPRR
jgi:hypothetical protein